MPPTADAARTDAPAYTLVLVSTPRVNQRWDFELVAQYVTELALDIEVLVVDDEPPDADTAAIDATRPMLTFSPGPIQHLRPPRGAVAQGIGYSKTHEYIMLARAGVPVPRWARVTRDETPDLSSFGPYVVMKPDRGGRGADIRIMRRSRVRWRPFTTDFMRSIAESSGNDSWVVQDFVYTGPYPVSYRVTTLFGEPLWGWRSEALREQRPLAHREDFTGDAVSVVATGRGCTYTLFEDSTLFALARRAHAAVRDVPLLGVDIIIDHDTGAPYVIEVNAVGFVWHLTSPSGRHIQSDNGIDVDAHFDVRRRAARILVDQVRGLAT